VFPLYLILRGVDWIRHQVRCLQRLPRSRALGRRGEDLAHRYLQRQGYRVVARNFTPRGGHGELDLIAWHGEHLVVVEVKSRQSDGFGTPDRALDENKRRALFRVAREFARRAEVPWDRVRFDLVSVIFRPRVRNRPLLEHQRDIFPVLYSERQLRGTL
jgi:putative endonuclease